MADAPTASVAREDAVAVQVADDVLDAHLTLGAVAMERKPVDEAHRFGVERVYIQLLLDLRAALLGRDDTVADGWQRTVPKALPGVFLQGADDVLGVLLGLILVEKRHDLPHHDVHRIVAHLLGDGDELHPILRELPDVEFQLEVIAEKAAKRMDDHNVERRGFGRARFDHALELGPAVVCGRRARLHIRLDELVAARGAIGFALLALVGDRDIVLGLPRRRDAQVKGGAQRHGHVSSLLLTSSAWPEQLIEQIAEPRLEHVHLGLGNWNLLGPIVGDGPGREVVLRRPAGERPRVAEQLFKLLGDPEDRFEDGPGHVGSIAPTGAKQNGP
ncbi:MAG: hypothetical protein WB823_14025 [Steroidobacteraceae bacterium]